MLQGPIGLVPTAGRSSTMLSYGYRSTVHDLVLPETVPGTPQVSYTPQSSDLPLITGIQPNVNAGDPYSLLWYHFILITIKNYSATNKTIYFLNRKSGSTYNSDIFIIPGNSHMGVTTTYGLDAPGFGNSEDFKLYCSGGAGQVVLSKSFFTLLPYYFFRGLNKTVYNIELYSSCNSLFGGTATGTGGLFVVAEQGDSLSASSDYASFFGGNIPSSLCMLWTMKWGTSTSSWADMNNITHQQVRYPTALLFTPSVR